MSETEVSAHGGEGPTDDEVRNAIGEGAAAAGEVDGARAQRFYDRIRGRIHSYLETKGAALGKTADVLLLVPDIFILLWRLTTDSRVSGKNKVLLGSGIAYYIFPFDFLPEGLMGPMGFVDDLVFAVYVLNKVLSDTDAEVLREHWSGPGDIFESMQKVLKAADTLVGTDLMNKIRRMVK